VPVNHMVWIKFAADIDDERIAAHLAALRGLPKEVPGIIDLTIGPNFTDRANGYTHGLSVILENKASLADYSSHPAHIRVASDLRRDADIMALDYQF
jgi:hypothetical protein